MHLQENSHQLLATMFADIQGYTALMQNDEQASIEVVKVFKDTVEREVADHGGKIIQFYGDAIMAVFPSSVNAVSAAQIIQRAFNSAGNIPVRIGINSGDVLYRDGNIFGDSVNIASRIESMGVAGSVLISKDVQTHIKNKKDIKTESLGVFEFKNVEEGIEVFALTSQGITRPLPTQLKGKFKRGFQVKTEKSEKEIELEKKRKIAKVAIPGISASVILFAIYMLIGLSDGGFEAGMLWILFPIIPIALGVFSKIASIKLYNDPDALKNEKAKDKLREKQRKRQAKIDAKAAKREARRQAKIRKRNPKPPPPRKPEPIELPEDDEDIMEELELKELHKIQREQWNDDDFV